MNIYDLNKVAYNDGIYASGNNFSVMPLMGAAAGGGLGYLAGKTVGGGLETVGRINHGLEITKPLWKPLLYAGGTALASGAGYGAYQRLINKEKHPYQKAFNNIIQSEPYQKGMKKVRSFFGTYTEKELEELAKAKEKAEEAKRRAQEIDNLNKELKGEAYRNANFVGQKSTQNLKNEAESLNAMKNEAEAASHAANNMSKARKITSKAWNFVKKVFKHASKEEQIKIAKLILNNNLTKTSSLDDPYESGVRYNDLMLPLIGGLLAYKAYDKTVNPINTSELSKGLSIGDKALLAGLATSAPIGLKSVYDFSKRELEGLRENQNFLVSNIIDLNKNKLHSDPIKDAIYKNQEREKLYQKLDEVEDLIRQNKSYKLEQMMLKAKNSRLAEEAAKAYEKIKGLLR